MLYLVRKADDCVVKEAKNLLSSDWHCQWCKFWKITKINLTQIEGKGCLAAVYEYVLSCYRMYVYKHTLTKENSYLMFINLRFSSISQSVWMIPKSIMSVSNFLHLQLSSAWCSNLLLPKETWNMSFTFCVCVCTHTYV